MTNGSFLQNETGPPGSGGPQLSILIVTPGLEKASKILDYFLKTPPRKTAGILRETGGNRQDAVFI